MDQAQKVEDNGGNKALHAVFHEVIESFIALKTGTGVHTVGTDDGTSTYATAHQGAKDLDPSYRDNEIHKDMGHAVPGSIYYYHRNPTNQDEKELFRIPMPQQ